MDVLQKIPACLWFVSFHEDNRRENSTWKMTSIHSTLTNASGYVESGVHDWSPCRACSMLAHPNSILYIIRSDMGSGKAYLRWPYALGLWQVLVSCFESYKRKGGRGWEVVWEVCLDRCRKVDGAWIFWRCNLGCMVCPKRGGKSESIQSTDK